MTQLDLLQLLGGTLAKGLLLLLTAMAAVRLLSRRSAAGRYAVWAAAFAGLVLLPVGSLLLPSLEPPRPGPVESMPHGQPMSVPVPPARMGLEQRPMASMRMSGRGMAATMEMPAAVELPRFGAWRRLAGTAAPWLLVVWLAGALAAISRLVADVRRVRQLARRAALLRRGPLYDLAADVAAELGVRQPVRIALSREFAVPVVCGLLRPIVILPAPARRWDPERRRVVLRHELAHVRRGDYAGHLLIELACAMHWPNPLAWMAARRARLEQEQACDDRVLALGTGPVEYAEHLLDIARAFARPTPHARGALAMAAAATLPGRMRAILDVGLDHRPAGRRTVLAVAGAALLVGMPTAALHPWKSGPSERDLVARLDEPDPLARRDALWSLGARGATGAEAAIARRLGDGDPATRGVAAWALGKLGEHSAVDPLIATLRDPDAHVREMAVLALGELRDPRAVPALAALADDPEHGVRSVMTVALHRIEGEAAAEALARLARSDPDAHTRVMAAGALGKFRSRVRVPALEDALDDPAPEVRANAASALERLGGRASVPALLAALDRETDAEVRDALIHALGATRDLRATDGLIVALADTVPQLRESAAQMLGELDDERAVDPLIAATRDPDHEVRLTAVWALDALKQAR
jgi:HEAT repeat protein/beta-lactamase regulating signal transducer with metallopeptidase domain